MRTLVQSDASHVIGGYGMREHLASFLEAADMAATDVYQVDENQAITLDRASRYLLKEPGLTKDAMEAREVSRRLKALAQSLYNPDFSECAPLSATRLRRVAINMDVLARRIEFGIQLRSLRMRQGISQKELALRANIDPGYESRLERFLAGPPSIEVAQQLASALGDAGFELYGAYNAFPAWHPSVAPRHKASAEQNDLLKALIAVCCKLPSEYLRIILVQVQAVCDLLESKNL